MRLTLYEIKAILPPKMKKITDFLVRDSLKVVFTQRLLHFSIFSNDIFGIGVKLNFALRLLLFFDLGHKSNLVA